MTKSSVLRFFILCGVFSLLAGCGASTDGTVSAAATVGSGVDAQKAQSQTRSELDYSGSVETVFTPALGGSGKGLVMAELKSHGGKLRDPDAKYDVFDAESSADLKTLGQTIQASLDRDHSVLIDSDGTPESRAKAAQISYEAIGASMPDMAAVVIRKIPEENGGGFGLIPIYSRADVAEQIAQGKIEKPDELNNSVEQFFFVPE